MSNEKQTEIPGISEDDIEALVAGARIACSPAYGESDKLSQFIDEVFAKPEVAKVQTRVE